MRNTIELKYFHSLCNTTGNQTLQQTLCRKRTRRWKWTCRACESAAGRRPRTACWLTAGGTPPSGTAPADTAAWRRPPLSGSTPRSQLEEEPHACYQKPLSTEIWVMWRSIISVMRSRIRGFMLFFFPVWQQEGNANEWCVLKEKEGWRDSCWFTAASMERSNL